MAAPDVQTLTEWTWVKVATSVTTGLIHRLVSTVDYYQTYRPTGEAAPTAPTQGTIPEEAVRMFEHSITEPISSSDLIDVYVMCANSDEDASDDGKIRVDL